MITYTNKLNMTPGQVPVTIHVNQYDSDFSLVFNLYNTVGTFTVESGTTAAIRGTKTDGTGYSVNATLDISNKRVTVSGDQQMTAAAGINVFELVLTKNSKELNTANFVLDVERAALDKDTIASDSVIKELIDVIDRTDEIIEAADKADAAIHAYTLIIQDAYPVSGATPLSAGWLEDEDGDVIVPDADHVYVLKEASSPYVVGDQFRWSGSTYVEVLDEGGSSVPKTSTTPKMDGTAAIGSETAYAAGDHVHPTDTTRAPLASPAFTGTPTAPTATVSTNSTQIATTAFVHDMTDPLVTGVSDVEVDGTSVVTNGIAGITSPNAFANVKVGGSTIAADQKDDTLELEAGSNISLTADTTNDKVTIAGNYSTATTSADGLMSSTDKAAVDTIGDTPMGTTATTITGAIAEHEQDISDLNSKTNYTICGSTRAYKNSKTVTIRFSLNDTVNDIINANPLPESYRPADSIYTSVMIVDNTSDKYYSGYIVVDRTTGKIDVYILQSYDGNITKITGGTIWKVLGSVTYLI